MVSGLPELFACGEEEREGEQHDQRHAQLRRLAQARHMLLQLFLHL